MEGALISLRTLRALFLAGLGQLFVGLGLYLWGHKIGSRLGGWWRRATWLPLAGVVASAFGIAYALWQLRRVDRALHAAPASEKASRLAEGISSMMNVSGGLALLSWALYIASIVVFTLGALQTPTPPHSEVPESRTMQPGTDTGKPP